MAAKRKYYPLYEYLKAQPDAGLLERNMRQSCDLDITVGLALKGLMLKAQALGVGSCILTAPLVFIEDVDQLQSFLIGIKFH